MAEQDARGQSSLRIPQQGDKKALMETVARNAQQSLVLHKTKRASDLTTRSRAWRRSPPPWSWTAPRCASSTTTSRTYEGDDVVASMVVFEDGLARKSEYRRFQIKGFEGQDDVRSMHEVITRRFRRYLFDKERTGEWSPEHAEHAENPKNPESGESGPPSLTEEDGRPKRFAYPPQLVVVDGGQPQVAAAKRALDELGIDDIAVCGLAKRLEEVWVPDEDDPVILPRTSEGLYLLQRVRDEAHRFRHHLPAHQAGQALQGGTAGRGAGSRRGAQADGDQALRFREAAPRGDDRPDLRGSRGWAATRPRPSRWPSPRRRRHRGST
ncbi:UvrABC system protein C [Streptomyces alboniger]